METSTINDSVDAFITYLSSSVEIRAWAVGIVKHAKHEKRSTNHIIIKTVKRIIDGFITKFRSSFTDAADAPLSSIEHEDDTTDVAVDKQRGESVNDFKTAMRSFVMALINIVHQWCDTIEARYPNAHLDRRSLINALEAYMLRF